MATCDWNHMLTRPSTNAAKKNGSNRTMSFHTMRARRHHATPNKTHGNGATSILLNNASRNNPREPKTQSEVLSRSSNLKKASSDRQKNISDNVFFSSGIHATDSTFTGCRA